MTRARASLWLLACPPAIHRPGHLLLIAGQAGVAAAAAAAAASAASSETHGIADVVVA